VTTDRREAGRPLTIAHTEASTGWGGQEIRILTEAAGLQDRGHRVMLYASPGARILDEAPRYGVHALAVPIGRKTPRAVLALARALVERPIDVVNAHSSTDTWAAALGSRLVPDAPALVRTRHVAVRVPNKVSSRWLYRRATTRLVTTGDALRDQLIADTGIAPDRIDSVPTGIDPARFGPGNRALARAQCGLPVDRALVGIIATLRSWKGHRYLIDALPRLARKDVSLVIVGEGPQRAALTEQVRELRLDERVIFAGNQADVAPWLTALDVVAMPSYANEGVPQAMLQAMFAGIPCVTTDAGAIPEIARADHTAVIVAREDTGALAAGIDRLLGDPALAERLARNARAFVLGRYTLDAMLDRMEVVFRKAVQQRGSGAGARAR